MIPRSGLYIKPQIVSSKEWLKECSKNQKAYKLLSESKENKSKELNEIRKTTQITNDKFKKEKYRKNQI